MPSLLQRRKKSQNNQNNNNTSNNNEPKKSKQLKTPVPSSPSPTTQDASSSLPRTSVSSSHRSILDLQNLTEDPGNITPNHVNNENPITLETNSNIPLNTSTSQNSLITPDPNQLSLKKIANGSSESLVNIPQASALSPTSAMAPLSVNPDNLSNSDINNSDNNPEALHNLPEDNNNSISSPLHLLHLHRNNHNHNNHDKINNSNDTSNHTSDPLENSSQPHSETIPIHPPPSPSEPQPQQTVMPPNTTVTTTTPPTIAPKTSKIRKTKRIFSGSRKNNNNSSSPALNITNQSNPSSTITPTDPTTTTTAPSEISNTNNPSSQNQGSSTQKSGGAFAFLSESIVNTFTFGSSSNSNNNNNTQKDKEKLHPIDKDQLENNNSVRSSLDLPSSGRQSDSSNNIAQIDQSTIPPPPPPPLPSSSTQAINPPTTHTSRFTSVFSRDKKSNQTSSSSSSTTATQSTVAAGTNGSNSNNPPTTFFNATSLPATIKEEPSKKPSRWKLISKKRDPSTSNNKEGSIPRSSSSLGHYNHTQPPFAGGLAAPPSFLNTRNNLSSISLNTPDSSALPYPQRLSVDDARSLNSSPRSSRASMSHFLAAPAPRFLTKSSSFRSLSEHVRIPGTHSARVSFDDESLNDSATEDPYNNISTSSQVSISDIPSTSVAPVTPTSAPASAPASASAPGTSSQATTNQSGRIFENFFKGEFRNPFHRSVPPSPVVSSKLDSEVMSKNKSEPNENNNENSSIHLGKQARDIPELVLSSPSLENLEQDFEKITQNPIIEEEDTGVNDMKEITQPSSAPESNSSYPPVIDSENPIASNTPTTTKSTNFLISFAANLISEHSSNSSNNHNSTTNNNNTTTTTFVTTNSTNATVAANNNTIVPTTPTTNNNTTTTTNATSTATPTTATTNNESELTEQINSDSTNPTTPSGENQGQLPFPHIPAPPISLASTFKAPLYRIRRKTASMLFSNDTSSSPNSSNNNNVGSENNQGNNSREIPSAPITPSSEVSFFLTPKENSSLSPAKNTVDPNNLNSSPVVLNGDNSRTPTPTSQPQSSSGSGGAFFSSLFSGNSKSVYPLQRTLSNQSPGKDSPKSDISPASSSFHLSTSRPRSRTLSSLDPHRASTGFFSNKHSEPNLSSLNSAPGSHKDSKNKSLRANSPSPTSSSQAIPSVAPNNGLAPSPRPSTQVPIDPASISLPPVEDDDTPATYLRKIRFMGLGGSMAGALARVDDEFNRKVLKLFVNGFHFQNDPLDMALRKFLISVKLPRETQQIDRVLEAFAFRYHECNPEIYNRAEDAYFFAFSLVLLHTDYFNPNNKMKMQKSDYLRVKTDKEHQDIPEEILGVSIFLSNIFIIRVLF